MGGIFWGGKGKGVALGELTEGWSRMSFFGLIGAVKDGLFEEGLETMWRIGRNVA